MGASNWAVCPRCVNRARKGTAGARERLAAVLDAAGDALPVAEREAALAAVKDPDLGDFRTFREDYEIHGAGDGTITVDYSGGCRTCGLSLSFKHSHEIEGTDG